MDKVNPKYVQAQKEGKVPLEHLVWEVLEDEAWVLQHGAEKYGFRNWRTSEIQASTYVAAILRHTSAIAKGEWIDPDSGKPHLAHIRACCTVWQDSVNKGTCIDDLERTEAKEIDIRPGTVITTNAKPGGLASGSLER